MKKYFYDKYDAGKAFFWAVLLPQLVAFVLSFLFTMIAFMVGGVEGADTTYDNIINNVFTNMLLILIPQLAFFLVYALFSKRKDYRRASRLISPGWQNSLVVVVLAVILVFLLTPISNYVAEGLFGLGLQMDNSLPLPLDNFGWLVLNLILLAALPAFCEELLFRGLILNGLRSLGEGKAILLSATLFMLMHSSPIQTVFPFLFGLVLGYVVIKTNSVVPAMIIHFTNNALVVILNYVGFEYSFGSLPTWAGVLIAIAFVGVAVLVTWLAGKLLKKRELPEIRPEEGELEGSVALEEARPNTALYIGIAVAAAFWLIVLVSGFTGGI